MAALLEALDVALEPVELVELALLPALEVAALLLALLELAELPAGLALSPSDPPPPHALIPTASRSAAISVESFFMILSPD